MADTSTPQDREPSSSPARDIFPEKGWLPDSAPGAPGSTASSHTPGPNTGGVHAGGLSAGDLAGGGAGGDIDHPDITGRGSTEDLTGGTRTTSEAAPQTKKEG